MSTVICKKTGIILNINDGILGAGDDLNCLFMLTHPLADYQQVRRTFKGSQKDYSHDYYRPLLAGSLLTILLKHDLLKVHGEEQALWANNIICKQAKSNGQLLFTIHLMLAHEDKLKTVSEGFYVKGEVRKRQYKFCLGSCMTQGQEKDGANQGFLKSLLDWISTLLPATIVPKVLIAPTNNSADIPIARISLAEEGSGNIQPLVEMDELVESIKNQIEDRVYRRIKRVPIDDIKRRLRDLIKLSQSYGIISSKQVKKLQVMVRNELLVSNILTRYVELATLYAVRELNPVKRNKAFEVVAWFKAADIEFNRRGMWTTSKAEQALEEVLELKGSEEKESLQDKLNRLNKSSGGKV